MMKWWGWGDENISFPMAEKPNLWPWIKKTLGIKEEVPTPPVSRGTIRLPAPLQNLNFTSSISLFLKSDQILTSEEERLLHTYGKSYPDLVRVRRGEIRRAPDLVVLPEKHDEVEAIISLAHKHDVVVIPFGGGTNIVGGINPGEDKRMVVSLDLRRMNALLAVDPYSRTATLQTGAIGPKLEADLQAQGYSLGHFPDSFEYSTLGGWLATRSAGMQSDAYGKIEEMVVALKLVTPTGTVTTKPFPASSAGPDLNRLIVGSEGVLGVITEATMRVHRTPPVKDYRGFLFPNFELGVEAIHQCIERGFIPSMVRFQDSGETELAFNMKAPKHGWKALIEKPIKAYLKRSGYQEPCIMVIGFEGEARPVAAARHGALTILRQYRGFALGKSVGTAWSADKFNIPYLRDYVMDFGCMADVSETSAIWSQVMPLYRNVVAGVKEMFSIDRGAGYIGCHISHTYKTGACLYFTYAAQQERGREIEQYYEYKRLVTDLIVKHGGTLSHHHAVGTEHLPWVTQEVSPTGVKVLRAMKQSVDPKSILNPGKLIPRAESGPVYTTHVVDQSHQSCQ